MRLIPFCLILISLTSCTQNDIALLMNATTKAMNEASEEYQNTPQPNYETGTNKSTTCYMVGNTLFCDD